MDKRLDSADLAPAPRRITLGDPVPWFSATSIHGAPIDLHVDAGRWVVLAFLDAPDTPRAAEVLAALLGLGLFREDRIVLHVIAKGASPALERLAAASGPEISVINDADGALHRRFGATPVPRTIVLDPMLRAIADIGWDQDQAVLAQLLRQLPDVDDSAGVPLSAPILIVPRVLDFEFCDLLVGLYERMGGTESGFLLDRDGKTGTVVDHRLKRRQDMIIALPELRATIRTRLVTRLLPAIERFFQFRATRIDRYLVSCYDAARGGYFFRHRDNINAGARHRRFAVTVNLNGDYDGCDLVFPEFGKKRYRAPVGGAIVFSCGALHEVTPVTRGRRYAFIPFLYGEEDAALRKANNENLAAGEAHYEGESDRLFPPAA
jgi:peroxiredoxin